MDRNEIFTLAESRLSRSKPPVFSYSCFPKAFPQLLECRLGSEREFRECGSCPLKDYISEDSDQSRR